MSNTLSKNFEHQAAEQHWYAHWLANKYFKSTPNEKTPYTIVMPPPNVTGVLHMGHCLNNTIQDILIRRARSMGYNACWVPGTDHASIATEAKVVGMLREQGIAKSSLSRADFLTHAWDWKEKYGGIILQQLKKLGCSLDWDRTTFTMDPDYYESVIKVFEDLHKKGVIYRGKRMINWDVKALTALSDEEVIRKEVRQKLYHINYAVEGFENGITVATVRPETIMGDAAICVNPLDERYLHLHGKFAFVPLINRRIPIIADEYVTMDFGTGALKVTPAHDVNDYALGTKHQLEIIDVFNDDGTLSEAAQIYVGLDRFEARKKIALELEEKGFLLKTEEYTSEVGFSERTDVVVEPRLSLQWWLSMKEIATPALKAVMEEEIQFFPPKFRNVYRHWMENIKDWCVSRQLWWGHRIPAWYDEKGNVTVAQNEEKAIEKYMAEHGKKPESFKQDEDCLDTWFSSWLWPFEVFKGYSHPGNEEIKYYYPTNTLVTAPEIIFFWVARMIMAGQEYMKAIPFKEVYFTGIVRDKLGRKMSKSLGNSPDLLGLIDQYGADASRFGIMIASPAGNDILFDESALEQGRNFNNKMWNALKLVHMWKERVTDLNAPTPFAVLWFEERLKQVTEEVDAMMKQFRLSEALKTIYSLIWDDFCSWYLEWVKPGFEQPIEENVFDFTVEYFTELMQLLHPFMPFITEDIYHKLDENREVDLCMRQFNTPLNAADQTILEQGQILKDIITGIRDIRNKQQIKPKETIELHIQTETPELFTNLYGIIEKQLNTSDIKLTDASVPGSFTAVIGKNTFYIISEKPTNTAHQREELEKELDYLKGFLVSVEKKLGNERFVQNAKPEIIELENKKKADAENKIRIIQESLTKI
jgi:valyl-tRNA synthetase